MKPGAAAQIAAQPGWYHALAGLLIESVVMVTPTDEAKAKEGINLIDLKSPEEESSLDEMLDMPSEMDESCNHDDNHDRVSRSSVEDIVLFSKDFAVEEDARDHRLRAHSESQVRKH